MAFLLLKYVNIAFFLNYKLKNAILPSLKKIAVYSKSLSNIFN